MPIEFADIYCSLLPELDTSKPIVRWHKIIVSQIILTQHRNILMITYFKFEGHAIDTSKGQVLGYLEATCTTSILFS